MTREADLCSSGDAVVQFRPAGSGRKAPLKINSLILLLLAAFACFAPSTVAAQCLSDLGAPVEIDESSLLHNQSRVVPLLDGSFLVVWSSPSAVVDARRVSASGLPLGGVIDVDESTTESIAQLSAFSARNDDGGVLVAWTAASINGPRGVRVRGLDPTGSPAGAVETIDGLTGPVIRGLVPAGSKFLLLAYNPSESRNLHAAFVDGFGVAEGPFFLLPFVDRGPGFASASLSPDNALALLAWQDFEDWEEGRFAIVRTAEIDNPAAPVASGHLLSGKIEDILPTDTGWLITYQKTLDGGLPRIFLLGIDHGGVITDHGVRLSDDRPDFVEHSGRLARIEVSEGTAFALSWESRRTVDGPTGPVHTYLASVAKFSPLGSRLEETVLLAVNDDVFPRARPTRPEVQFSPQGVGLATWMGDLSESSGVWVRRVGRGALFCDGFESGDLARWQSPPP